ncbi:MAG: 2,3-bisphosphoglycerate-independent phosphoglycerate mutase [Gemmatimonadota bacterium]|nr:2,3-bisphosphoglycerate-independent phosphoglycerate mutase [Gemmatimonadota bacterium]
MNDSRKPTVLIICDGWGVGAPDAAGIRREGNAVAMARTPVRDRLLEDRPWSLLRTSGEAVGLPPGQMGNSEVGHLNLGAGRIVHQDVTRISMAVADRSFFALPGLATLAAALRRRGGALHLIGLCSDGGVHSEIGHLHALLDWAGDARLPVRVHCITDGRDTSPTSGIGWIEELAARTAAGYDARIATVSGRYFAMDRDRRWQRTERAYRAIVEGAGARVEDAAGYVARCYAEGTTDEFLPPVAIGPADPGSNTPEGRRGQEASPSPGIRPNDGILFFNFRADRARQLTAALTEPAFPHFPRPRGTFGTFVAMTRYEDDFPHPVLFPPRPIRNTLGEVLARAGRTQLRTAETEKYPHVTYFFNGGVEEPFTGEDRHLIPSPRVATYDLMPEMSAPELTDALLARLARGRYDFVLVNYANADMVGHTGSIPAAIAAVTAVDTCVGRLLDRIRELGGTALVTADHGNAEKMLDERGNPFTAHTTFPVRLILVSPEAGPRIVARRRATVATPEDTPRETTLRNGILADVAPTVLDLMGITQPPEMTGRSLLAAPAGDSLGGQ